MPPCAGPTRRLDVASPPPVSFLSGRPGSCASATSWATVPNTTPTWCPGQWRPWSGGSAFSGIRSTGKETGVSWPAASPQDTGAAACRGPSPAGARGSQLLVPRVLRRSFLGKQSTTETWSHSRSERSACTTQVARSGGLTAQVEAHGPLDAGSALTFPTQVITLVPAALAEPEFHKRNRGSEEVMRSGLHSGPAGLRWEPGLLIPRPSPPARPCSSSCRWPRLGFSRQFIIAFSSRIF